jgi:sporulation protein YlmC with PRC-barrel domain
MMSEDMAEKKLRGSGGFAIATITDQEQKMANLGGPELFLAGIGRLSQDRFIKYHCNKCEREFEGSPTLTYENPNEDLGEGVTLVEKGEYKCRACNATIAQYRKFEAPSQLPPPSLQKTASQPMVEAPAPVAVEGFVSIQSLVGMAAYDGEAMLVGRVQEVGLRKAGGKAQISIKIASASGESKEYQWEGISKIGDIILLQSAAAKTGKCASCGAQNESDAQFCEECGAKLS